MSAEPKKPDERREHPRFKSQAFIGIPVRLNPVPPHIGAVQSGQLMGLSAGGMSILISAPIPVQEKFLLDLTFPDRSLLKCTVVISRVDPQMGRYLVGLKFIDLADFLQFKVDRMSDDFFSCEQRIKAAKDEICRLDCSFMNLCDKMQKISGTEQVDHWLQMNLKTPGQ